MMVTEINREETEQRGLSQLKKQFPYGKRSFPLLRMRRSQDMTVGIRLLILRSMKLPSVW